MFVTCHINFWPLSNFVGTSLEVTRTTSNNKLHFTWGCSILLLKKGKGPWDRLIIIFFNDSDIFLSILILTITSLAIHSGVLSGFIFHSSTRAWLALALASRLPPFDRKTLKNCACSADPGLLNETKGSWFPLSCLSSHHDEW